MVDKKVKKITTVHEHPMHIPVSKKHPTGITIRHQHKRRIYTSFNSSEIKETTKNYKRKGIPYPSSQRLSNPTITDKYDDLIAVWVDYFNSKFPAKPPLSPLDPNVVKALIDSESDFNPDPKSNKTAIGIAQITKPTLKALQDPEGELKDYLFKDIRQMDLKDPDIAIPLAIRWLARKRETASNRLGHPPSTEELILEYKGLLTSNSEYRNNALKKFRESYEKLTRKK